MAQVGLGKKGAGTDKAGHRVVKARKLKYEEKDKRQHKQWVDRIVQNKQVFVSLQLMPLVEFRKMGHARSRVGARAAHSQSFQPTSLVGCLKLYFLFFSLVVSLTCFSLKTTPFCYSQAHSLLYEQRSGRNVAISKSSSK